MPSAGALASMGLTEKRVAEHGRVEGSLKLDRPTPSGDLGGAVVFLSSSDHRLASVPQSVTIPAGKTEATFLVTIAHIIGDGPQRVRIRAAYGGRVLEAPLAVHRDPSHDAVPGGGVSSPPPGQEYYPLPHHR